MSGKLYHITIYEMNVSSFEPFTALREYMFSAVYCYWLDTNHENFTPTKQRTAYWPTTMVAYSGQMCLPTLGDTFLCSKVLSQIIELGSVDQYIVSRLGMIYNTRK